MAEMKNYQMAVDLLCCHLGISEDEAKQQLGIKSEDQRMQDAIEVQHALMGLDSQK